MQNKINENLQRALKQIAVEREALAEAAEAVATEQLLFRKDFNGGKEPLERSQLGIYVERPKGSDNISVCWRHFVTGKPIEKSIAGGTKKISLTKRINKGRGNAYTKAKLSRYAKPGELQAVMEFEERLAFIRERLRNTSLAAKYIKKAIATPYETGDE